MLYHVYNNQEIFNLPTGSFRTDMFNLLTDQDEAEI